MACRGFTDASSAGGSHIVGVCRFRRPCGRQTAELAREHGIFRTAKTLRLEHSKLKGMVKVKSTKPAVRRAPTPPAADFLELVAPLPSVPGLTECVIELEGPRGKMRIQWKGAAAPDLAGLSRALWESA